MRRRYLCWLCLVFVTAVIVLRTAGGARFFPELGPAVSERELSDKEKVVVRGTVGEKSEKDGKLSIVLQDITFNTALPSDENILVYLEAGTHSYIPEIGESILVSGKIKFYQRPRNPGNFNQKFYYQRQKIYAFVGDARLEDDSGRGQRDTYSILEYVKEWLWKLRKRAAQIIALYLGHERGGMLCAMLLGEKAFLDVDIQEAMSRSGIGHLFAVSGLHVSFFGFGVYRLLRRTGLPIWSCAVSASLVLWLYVELTGGSISAVRAYIMFVIRMGAEAGGRVYDGLTALSVSAIFILIRQPLALWDAGFLLSFAAVLGIYGVLPVLKGCLENGRSGQFLQGIMTAVSVNLVVLPIMLWYYFEFPVYSLFWNVIVVLLAPVVMAAGLSGTVLGAAALHSGILRAGAAAAFWGTDKILWFYEIGSRFWLMVPGNRIVVGQPSMGKVVLYYLCLTLGLILVSMKKRGGKSYGLKTRLAVWTSILIGAGVMFLPKGRRGETEVVMLDVGQGDCFFIRGPENRTYLIDGGSSTVGKAGRYRIEPFLKSQGVGTLDYIFVSHGDADHLNGIQELLERQEVGVGIRNLILPGEEVWDTALTELAGTASEKGVRVLVMEQGEALGEKELSLTCLWPQNGFAGENGNQASMVLSLSYKEFDMLFTGDLEKEGEQEFVRWLAEEQREGYLLGGYEVLKVGHHGSKNATSQVLLETTAPQDVLISAGQGNSYGHPHREVLERLAKWGCTLYNTKEQGAVSLSTDGTSYRVELPMQKRRIIVY